MDKLRLRFAKTGRAVYTSHLDVMRTMQRSFLRAGIPLKYSEGFNPHPQISVLLPMSLGTSSVCELMDFRVAEKLPGNAVQLLNRALPEGIQALEIYESDNKPVLLKWLQVEGRLEYDSAADKVSEAMSELFSRENLIVVRKTKRGEKETDIRPAINQISLRQDGEEVRLSAVISAQEPTLNPQLLISAIAKYAPGYSPDFCRFERIETYDAKMSVFR